MVNEDPYIVFQYDDMKQTGLVHAIKRGHVKIMRLLLKHHSRVNFKDEVGKTALNYAVEKENVDMIKSLLCFKADP